MLEWSSALQPLAELCDVDMKSSRPAFTGWNVWRFMLSVSANSCTSIYKNIFIYINSLMINELAIVTNTVLQFQSDAFRPLAKWYEAQKYSTRNWVLPGLAWSNRLVVEHGFGSKIVDYMSSPVQTEAMCTEESHHQTHSWCRDRWPWCRLAAWFLRSAVCACWLTR